tara:strand:+ start:4848 stop:5543 length:696 start_codon:yes stop_codon:yes gene_type:complete
MIKRLLILPARSGSKRIKNKNIKLFAGKPIIYHPLIEGKKSGLFSKIHVSTDSKKISSIVENYGFKTDFLRPKSLAGDKTPTIDVLDFVIKKYEKLNIFFDEVWSMTPCSPLVNFKDLLKAAKILEKNKKKIVISVCSYPAPIEWAFYKKKNKLSPLRKDFYKKRSQDITKKYHDTGNFVGIPIFFFKKKKIDFDTSYIGYELPRSRAIDIDDIEDFKLAEFLYEYQQNNK